MVQYFSLTTKQHQPTYQPQKPPAEQPPVRDLHSGFIEELGSPKRRQKATLIWPRQIYTPKR